MTRSWIAVFFVFGTLLGVTVGASATDLPLALDGEDCVSFNPQNIQIQPLGAGVRMVDGSHALMAFDSEAEARQSLEVMRYYGFNRSCFVGRPGPSMHYFLVDDRAPTGAMPGEDCVSLDPDRIQARQVQDSWKMVDNDRWLMDFGAARIQAYTALAIVRHHGFSHHCFVARPGPALTYLRRDGDQPDQSGDSPELTAGPTAPVEEPAGSLLNIPQESLLLHLDAAHDYAGGVWRDHSQMGHDAEQSDPDRWPTRIDNAVGGHPALAFDGENDVLVSSLDINPSVNPDITVFVVFDSRTGDPVHRKLFGHDNGGFDRAVGLDSRSSKNLVFFGGRRGRTRSIVDIEADRWYLLTMNYTQATASAWVNGDQVADSVAVNNGRGESVTMIGNGGSGSAEWWGSIAEVIVYGESVPNAKRQAIERALMEKYGL